MEKPAAFPQLRECHTDPMVHTDTHTTQYDYIRWPENVANETFGIY